MSFDRGRERRNDDVYTEHKEALARGEKRVLRKTDTGELHSYPADEPCAAGRDVTDCGPAAAKSKLAQ